MTTIHRPIRHNIMYVFINSSYGGLFVNVMLSLPTNHPSLDHIFQEYFFNIVHIFIIILYYYTDWLGGSC